MRLIDADALKKQIESPYTEYPIMIQLRRAIKGFIDSAPTIEPKRGEWIVKQSGFAECSVCEQHYFSDYNFCPYCGADMHKESE